MAFRSVVLAEKRRTSPTPHDLCSRLPDPMDAARIFRIELLDCATRRKHSIFRQAEHSMALPWEWGQSSYFRLEPMSCSAPENGARVRPGLLSGRAVAGRSAFSPTTSGLSLAMPTAPISTKHSCSPSLPIRHRRHGRLRSRAKVPTIGRQANGGTGQLYGCQNCQGWGAAGQHRRRRALLGRLSRHRSPWFRRPSRDDLPVSGAMIDVAHVRSWHLADIDADDEHVRFWG